MGTGGRRRGFEFLKMLFVVLCDVAISAPIGGQLPHKARQTTFSKHARCLFGGVVNYCHTLTRSKTRRGRADVGKAVYALVW